MVRLSNVLAGIFNSVAILVSAAIIVLAKVVKDHGGGDCHKSIHSSLLFMGVVLLVLSIVGLIGACGGLSLLMSFYLLGMFLAVGLMIGSAIFTLVVTNRGAGEMSSKGIMEYRIEDYSVWLQKNVRKQWDGIRDCLAEADVCKSLGEEVGQAESTFYRMSLSPTQSGCCKPPNACGFVFENATFWIMAKSGPGSSDSDCKTWSNDQTKLCYDCNSCKGGLAECVKRKWVKIAKIKIGLAVFFSIVLSVGFCARKTKQ